MILKQGMATLTDNLGLLLEQLEAHHKLEINDDSVNFIWSF